MTVSKGSDNPQLADWQGAVHAALEEMRAERVIQRIWLGDHTVWNPEPTEISNRLGWLSSPVVMRDEIPHLTGFADEVRGAGIERVLLLGMGGSSLAPEVFQEIFGNREGYPRLTVLDCTVPGAVLARAAECDPARTLYVVSTKSGGTVETFSFFKYFFNQAAEQLGMEEVGAHFVAITDPGSKLEALAQELDFRRCFLNDPAIGGRYSVLSYFGLVPAALIGVDLDKLLERAEQAVVNCGPENNPVEGHNAGALGGAMVSALAQMGRDKLTFIASPLLAPFGLWAEQLVAESLGKDGKGVLPVDGEAVGPPAVYGDDRLFFHLQLEGDDTHAAAAAALADAGQPVFQVEFEDVYDLGGELFCWEMLTAVAGNRLGVHPFDQPNVESAKICAREMLAAYRKEGALPRLEPRLSAEGIDVIGEGDATDLAGVWTGFLASARPGDYVALQAYVQPTEQAERTLRALQAALRDRTKLATTMGFGPRFLHSTGQLHKGDAGRGLFVQITADDPVDAPIPDAPGDAASSVSFGVLKESQALGDRQALIDGGRRVIRFHLGAESEAGLARLLGALG